MDEEEEAESIVIGKGIPVIPLEATEGHLDVKINATSDSLAKKLRELASEFTDVLTDIPLCTNLEECTIKLSSNVPVRTKPYPVPFSTRGVKDGFGSPLVFSELEEGWYIHFRLSFCPVDCTQE